ncbi:DUF2934 domain-containing protein [Candidatus Omnitrophota bacterium]
MARRSQKAAKTTKCSSPQMNRQDMCSMVEKKAYELWQKKGGGVGKELDNWLEAEKLVKGKGK